MLIYHVMQVLTTDSATNATAAAVATVGAAVHKYC
jgi:hypothetical protein